MNWTGACFFSKHQFRFQKITSLCSYRSRTEQPAPCKKVRVKRQSGFELVWQFLFSAFALVFWLNVCYLLSFFSVFFIWHFDYSTYNVLQNNLTINLYAYVSVTYETSYTKVSQIEVTFGVISNIAHISSNVPPFLTTFAEVILILWK